MISWPLAAAVVAKDSALRQSLGAIEKRSPAPRRFEDGAQGRVKAIMGIRTWGLDMKTGFRLDYGCLTPET
jgi:hypothetical protein